MSLIDRIRAFFGDCEHYVTVRQGDSLWGITKSVTGSASNEKVDRLRELNPQITDPDAIAPGDRIRLPDEWFDA